MDQSRRSFLRGAASAGALGVVAGAGLLRPQEVLAAWPEAAFDAGNLDATIEALVGSTGIADSDAIKLKAPEIAENGAVVPVTVETTLPGLESISVIAENNPAPLAARFDLGPNAIGYVSTRIKMGETSNVIALVQSEGKLYRAVKEVKVTIGGCGG